VTTPKSPSPPFPEEAFTGVFAAHRALFCPTTEAPDAFHFGAMAAGLSFLVGRDTWLRSSTGRMYPNLNVALVADTGEFKSTTIGDTKDVIVSKFIPTPVQVDEPPRILVFDGNGSGEGFLHALADVEYTSPGAAGPTLVTGRRMLLTFHEFGEVLAKIRRDQAGNLNEVILGSLDARSLVTHVTKGKTLRITNGLIVLLSATTYETMARVLSHQANASGFINRVLWLGGYSTRRIARRPAADPKLEAQLHHAIEQVLSMVRGREMVMEAAAELLHDKNYNHHRDRSDAPAMRQATRRAPDQALKIAMLTAIANARTNITANDVRIAWQVVEYSRHFVGLLIDMIPAAGYGELEDRLFEKAKLITAEKGDTITKSDLWQRMKTPRLGWNTIMHALQSVVARGDIAPVPGSASRYYVKGEPPNGTTPAPTPAPLPFSLPVDPMGPVPPVVPPPWSPPATSPMPANGPTSSTTPPTYSPPAQTVKLDSPAPPSLPLPAPYIPGVTPLVAPTSTTAPAPTSTANMPWLHPTPPSDPEK